MRGSNVSITMCIIGFIATDNAVTALGEIQNGLPLQRIIDSAASPSDTALDIIRGAAAREKEMYTPFLKMYITTWLTEVCPSLMHYIMRDVYSDV
ncbi:hydroxysteroid 11-beta-dehydrogenase 1-like protein A [Argopecten irradians]|uniref:hydroxysteroid 11-beta-dehydrogenase 1-like protein A n=1 Tax=Argopecten irradians TaxID=31199 RepID=UPI003723A9A7